MATATKKAAAKPAAAKKTTLTKAGQAAAKKVPAWSPPAKKLTAKPPLPVSKTAEALAATASAAKQAAAVLPKPARKTAATGRKQHVRMVPAERKTLLLAAALKVATGKGGIAGLTRATIAKAANVTDGLVNRYLGNRGDMERAVSLAAVESKVVKVVAEGIGRGVLTQTDMPRNLWREARALNAK